MMGSGLGCSTGGGAGTAVGVLTVCSGTIAVSSSTPVAPGSSRAICSTLCCVAGSLTVPFNVTLPSLAATLTAESLATGSAATLLGTSFAIVSSFGCLEHPMAAPDNV